MRPLAFEKLTFEERLAVPPPVLFVAATMLMTREAEVLSAFEVIADVFDVNWSAWVAVTVARPPVGYPLGKPAQECAFQWPMEPS